jgi:hypothetical protein
MTLTQVALIAPVDDCEGGLGGGANPGGGVGVGEGEGEAYPTASFVDSGCCYTAQFTLGCQDYTELCGLYASQDVNFAYKLDVYKAKASYLDEPGEHDCPCIKVQSYNTTFDGTGKIYWVARYKLKSIKIAVGKININCSNSEGSVCKYYVAATYDFEFCDAIVSVLEYTKTRILTGHYKVDQCSTTETFNESSSINSCQNLLDSGPWQTCNASEVYQITRLKLFDSLPTGQLTITDADYPPYSVGGLSGCVLGSQSCGLNVVDNCVGNLPIYDGDPPSTYWFCTPVGDNLPPLDTEGCSLTPGCPTIEEKEGYTAGCETFEWNEAASCYQFKGIVSVDRPGFDRFYCGFCTIDGVTTKYYSSLFETYVIDPAFPDICETGECCFSEFAFGVPVAFNCQEFVSGYSPCRADILDYTCSIGEVQTFTTGAFCFNLPAVTIELS